MKRLLQNRFCKKFLGILFFGERVYIDIHNEPKNKIIPSCNQKISFVKIFFLLDFIFNRRHTSCISRFKIKK